MKASWVRLTLFSKIIIMMMKEDEDDDDSENGDNLNKLPLSPDFSQASSNPGSQKRQTE